jgi:asparagine N-glycosylation enzyme membrane subunit Stt3
MMRIFAKPSYYSLIFTGIIWLAVFFLIIQNFSSLKRSPEKMIIVLSLFGILVGVHGLIHLGLESYYNFNPLDVILNK